MENTTYLAEWEMTNEELNTLQEQELNELKGWDEQDTIIDAMIENVDSNPLY